MTTTPERVLTQDEQIDSLGRYSFGWADSDIAGAGAQRGLSEAVVRDISAKKAEPEWMLERRLKALEIFGKKPMPTWGADLSGINFDNIKYFVRSTEKQATSWEDLPPDIKNTWLVPEHADEYREFLAMAEMFDAIDRCPVPVIARVHGAALGGGMGLCAVSDLVIAEAGTGLGFVAVVIGYLPVLYQAFSRREVAISLLDVRAGSPPSRSSRSPTSTTRTSGRCRAA